MRQTLGVVGHGFVGRAVSVVFATRGFDVIAADVEQGLLRHSERTNGRPERVGDYIGESALLELTDGPIFVCVPTPMKPDGSCDTSIVEQVIAGLGTTRRIVLKSTVPPKTTERLVDKYGAHICFNPEFLTEANAVQDFDYQRRVILGGLSEATLPIRRLYHQAFPRAKVFETDATTAEMVKYATNCFLAVKVAFANELKDISDAVGAPYEGVRKLLMDDPRIGKTHWSVPGPDGNFGFGGSCFPKDLNALLAIARSYDTIHTVMEAAWQTNLAFRPGRDWEMLKGRAVVQDCQPLPSETAES